MTGWSTKDGSSDEVIPSVVRVFEAMVSSSGDEMLPRWLLSPEYWVVMEYVPGALKDVVRDAVFWFTGETPSAVGPEKNVTEPVRLPVTGDVTVAVNVTG